jgi:hypothetical protein
VRVTDATDNTARTSFTASRCSNPAGFGTRPCRGSGRRSGWKSCPQTHLTGLKIVTKIDGTVTMQIETSQDASNARGRVVNASLDGRVVAEASGAAGSLTLQIAEPKLWSPDSPTLYDLGSRSATTWSNRTSGCAKRALKRTPTVTCGSR